MPITLCLAGGGRQPRGGGGQLLAAGALGPLRPSQNIHSPLVRSIRAASPCENRPLADDPRQLVCPQCRQAPEACSGGGTALPAQTWLSCLVTDESVCGFLQLEQVGREVAEPREDFRMAHVSRGLLGEVLEPRLCPPLRAQGPAELCVLFVLRGSVCLGERARGVTALDLEEICLLRVVGQIYDRKNCFSASLERSRAQLSPMPSAEPSPSLLSPAVPHRRVESRICLYKKIFKLKLACSYSCQAREN